MGRSGCTRDAEVIWEGDMTVHGYTVLNWERAVLLSMVTISHKTAQQSQSGALAVSKYRYARISGACRDGEEQRWINDSAVSSVFSE